MPIMWKADQLAGLLKDLRVFWQITVQPNPNQNANSKIQVIKQGSLWGKIQDNGKSFWRRYYARSIDLTDAEKYPSLVEIKGVDILDNALHFDGESYLLIRDPGLGHFTKDWGLHEKLSGHSKSVVREIVLEAQDNPNPDTLHLFGTNIRIDAEVKVDGDQLERPIIIRKSKYTNEELAGALTRNLGLPNLHQELFQMFYGERSGIELPNARQLERDDDLTITPNAGTQLPNAIDFDKVFKNLKKINRTEIKLFLSREGSKTYFELDMPNKSYKTDDFELMEMLDPGFHLFTVQQDADRWKRNSNYLEFYVDSIQLNEKRHKIPGETIAQHYFSTGESNIYIGFDPDSDPKKFFKGLIRRLVFDPNASCLGCVG